MEKPAIWDGSYTKRMYVVHLPGECVVCWPNAGLMNAMDGSGRIFKPDGRTVITVMSDKEADRYDAMDEAEDAARPFPVANAFERFFATQASSPRPRETWADLHLQERKRLKRERGKKRKKNRR
jgi:hypothetical protein